MKKYILLILITLISVHAYCQFSRTNFKTDSTSVELVKNSEYRIWEETYNNKDAVFYSVRYIKDTTQINIEGWHRKNGQYIGKWSEYNIDGTWLYTIDYDKNTWKYNKEEFKYQPLKDKMKAKADIILLGIVGKEFFDNNIVFNFSGSTYIGKWETYNTGTFWSQDKYLGSWIEPVTQKPNTFAIVYSVKLSDHELYDDFFYIELDSIGNLIEKSLELKKIGNIQKKKFTITKEKAIQICKQNVLVASNATYKTYLKFGHTENTPYTGTFFYEVVQQYDEIKDENCRNNCEMIKYFNIWRFDPWSCKLLYKKSVKQLFELHRGCLTSGNYIELKN